MYAEKKSFSFQCEFDLLDLLDLFSGLFLWCCTVVHEGVHEKGQDALARLFSSFPCGDTVMQQSQWCFFPLKG